jgi:hypothetical protein
MSKLGFFSIYWRFHVFFQAAVIINWARRKPLVIRQLHYQDVGAKLEVAAALLQPTSRRVAALSQRACVHPHSR